MFIQTQHGRIEVLASEREFPFVVFVGGGDEEIREDIDTLAAVESLASRFWNNIGKTPRLLYLPRRQLESLSKHITELSLGLKPAHGDQPTVGKAVERIAHWLDKRAEGLPDAIHEACDAIDDTLLDQHRDSTTIRAPKLRADIRGFIVAAYEEGKRRGWRSNITEATDDRVRDEANRRGVIAVRATLDEIREHGGTLKAVYADATRSATPEKALGSMPLGGAAQALLKFGMESGPGIAVLPKPDDSHYLLDVDLLADDE